MECSEDLFFLQVFLGMLFFCYCYVCRHWNLIMTEFDHMDLPFSSDMFWGIYFSFR